MSRFRLSSDGGWPTLGLGPQSRATRRVSEDFAGAEVVVSNRCPFSSQTSPKPAPFAQVAKGAAPAITGL